MAPRYSLASSAAYVLILDVIASDKFVQRFGQQIKASERDAILNRVNEVFGVVRATWNDTDDVRAKTVPKCEKARRRC